VFCFLIQSVLKS